MSRDPAESGFSDHFSAVAAGYARFRPRYPEALFRWLASAAPSTRLAWDNATGTGQAARALTAHFERVVATDASAEQVARARAHPRVELRVARADDSGLEPASVDLITVAQALHWFDRPAFYAEARRVLRPGGLLAVWSYEVLVFGEPAIDRAVRRLHDVIVGPYWPPERRHVLDGYRGIGLPEPELPAAEIPDFAMETCPRLDALLGYLRTWSASRRYVEAHGRDPVARVEPTLRAAWGEPTVSRTARWPLVVRACRPSRS